MSSLDENGDRVALLQMNAELRHAQLEMLSAQCATDRLRLRYSAEDIARHAQRDTLRKACSSASALYEYYNGIARQVPEGDALEKSSPQPLSEAQAREGIARVAQYLREQRDHFGLTALPLDGDHRHTMLPFFSSSLLDQVRIVALDRQRIPNPPFYAEARAMGFVNLPELTHMASVAFGDVLVFHGEITDRSLFRALVRAVQFEVVGLERYTELLVRGFLRTRSHVNVPLEAHAFLLESEFAGSPAKVFSVEERVRLWTNQGRY
jgi:hypothetical protein